jgi:diguanylate cyclase (GGDEF)-like protein
MTERRGHRFEWALVAAYQVAHALAFPWVFGLLGPFVGVVPTSMVMLAAWWLGMRGAAVTAAFMLVANTLLYVAVGTELDVALRATAFSAALFLAIGVVIARLRADKERIARLTMFDRLTQLPNRDNFDNQLQRMLSAGFRAHLALIDVVGFREVNESFGRDVGNEVIREISRRLRVSFENDVVARVGADQFAVLSKTAGTDQMLAATVLAVFRAPFLIAGSLIAVQGRVGIARSPDHGETGVMLTSAAESATRSARKLVTGWAVASKTLSGDSEARLRTLGELRQALDRNELRLHYQPLLDVTTGSVVGFEALMRWQRDGELVPPAQFIPLAEQTGLIVPLTDWVVNEALRQSAEWARVGHPARISVNVSAKAIGAASHLETVIAEAALEHGVAASQLTVEVTETDVMTDPVRASQTLSGLKKLGVRVAVDDFGTGYSSLSYLNALPLDEVKIDQSFISRLLLEPQTSLIVRAAVDLSHALGLDAVAEGVEDAATLARLTELGCDRAQGYFFARPMPADAVLPWLQRFVPTPRVAVAPAAIRAASSRDTASTVLVVDDEHSLGVATNRILSGRGFNVVNAASGTEALRICAEQPIDLVVADIFLTDWRGHELAGRVRRLHPEMKFLFVSGDPSARALVQGAPFLAKPYSNQQLIDRVDSVLLGAA